MSLTFKQFLLEAPIPDDWESTKITTNSFANRIRYAKSKAQSIGVGSSRVAFKIPYNGRDTVLKIAKNKKGLAQNDHEAQMLTDWYAKSLNIMIPIIDYDEDSNEPTWLHVEYARKAKDSDFKRHIGDTLSMLIEYTEMSIGKSKYKKPTDYFDKLDTEHDLVQSFIDLVGNYGHPIGDYSRLTNWGVYDDRLVLVDVGINNDILKTYY